VVIAGALVYYFRPTTTGRSDNFNSNSNINSNSNRNSNTTANKGGHESANTSSANSSNEGVSSMSDDDKHKLFQAVGITRDRELVQRVLKKLDFIKPNGMISEDYAQFVKDHISWAADNVAFVNSINTPEKAQAYVDEHFKE
jgi:hypothetical protein